MSISILVIIFYLSSFSESFLNLINLFKTQSISYIIRFYIKRAIFIKVKNSYITASYIALKSAVSVNNSYDSFTDQYPLIGTYQSRFSKIANKCLRLGDGCTSLPAQKANVLFTPSGVRDYTLVSFRQHALLLCQDMRKCGRTVFLSTY